MARPVRLDLAALEADSDDDYVADDAPGDEGTEPAATVAVIPPVLDMRTMTDDEILANFAKRQRFHNCEHLTDKELFEILRPRIMAQIDPQTLMWKGCVNNVGVPVIGFASDHFHERVANGETKCRTIVYTVTHLVMLLAGNYPVADDQQASHLCHERLCCDPSHLIWESGTRNSVRNACIKAQHCLSQEEYAVRCYWQVDRGMHSGGALRQVRKSWQFKMPCEPSCLVGIHGARKLKDGRYKAAQAPKTKQAKRSLELV